MNYNQLSNELKKIEKEFEIYILDFGNNKVFKKTNNLYLKEDKQIIYKKWKRIKAIFSKLKKIINSHNYNPFSQEFNNRFVVKHYCTICYYNMALKLQETFQEHEEFVRYFLDEKHRENYSTIARFIYYPWFLYYLNYPQEFLLMSKDKINNELKWMLKKEVNYKIKLDFDYKNFYYYFKYRIDKLLYLLVKYWWLFLSHLMFKSSEKWLISNDCINKFYEVAKPWDIMLSRQTYVGTNVSIPWFWKHMSMYIWTWEYLQKNFNVEIFKKLDKNKHYIIESTGKWVCIEEFTDFTYKIDYLWVFRTSFSQGKIRNAILETTKMVNKDYDYLFNYYSDQQFVCSELITKSYLRDSDIDEWLTIELQKIASGLTYPPNEFARKAYNEKDLENKEIYWVIFIDSSQKKQQSFINTVEELLTSYKRSRFSFLLR